MACGLGGCCCKPVQSCYCYKTCSCTPTGKATSCSKTVITGSGCAPVMLTTEFPNVAPDAVVEKLEATTVVNKQ